MHEFIARTLGFAAQQRYKIIIGDHAQAAREMVLGIEQVRVFRRTKADAYHFNWQMHIDHEYQRPFEPTHANMAKLELRKDMPVHLLAANLRRAFSGIVAGNVKEQGIRLIEQHGPYEINGDPTSWNRSTTCSKPSSSNTG